MVHNIVCCLAYLLYACITGLYFYFAINTQHVFFFFLLFGLFLNLTVNTLDNAVIVITM